MPWTWKANKHTQLSLWSSWKFGEWSQPECWGRHVSWAGRGKERVSPVSTQTSKLRCPPPLPPPPPHGWCVGWVTHLSVHEEGFREEPEQKLPLWGQTRPLGATRLGATAEQRLQRDHLRFPCSAPGSGGRLASWRLNSWSGSHLPCSPAFKDLIAPHCPVKFVPSLPLAQNSRLHASTSSSSFSSLIPFTYSVFQPICTPPVPKHTLYFLSRCLWSCRSFHLQRTFSLCQNSARSSGLSSNAAPRPAP